MSPCIVENSLVLNLEGVKKAFNGRAVLEGINLQLRQGECLALLGPNGAGKSTTIRIALGLSPADEGVITVLGCKMPEQGQYARALIGVVPQYDALDPDFTVLENLLVFGGFFHIDRAILKERSAELVEFAALGQRANQSVGQLSGGMKRRLSLARALINKPKLIFLDEPTTALDPQAKHLIWERLLQLKRQGISLFLTTHFMDEAQRLADRVAVLDQGRIIEEGTPKELINKYVGRMVLEVWGKQADEWVKTQLNRDHDRNRSVDSMPPIPELGREGAIKTAIGTMIETKVVDESGINPEFSAMPKSDEIERRGESFFLQGEPAEVFFSRLKSQAPVEVEYLYRPGNLEDVFFRLTGRDLRDD